MTAGVGGGSIPSGLTSCFRERTEVRLVATLRPLTTWTVSSLGLPGAGTVEQRLRSLSLSISTKANHLPQVWTRCRNEVTLQVQRGVNFAVNEVFKLGATP
ncbi:unnamed protein product [Timema podura]|uniref:Uncharacterized protein n=1 Tax=Timema podura TaxID=61482 RepID=A0ABN7NV60_TIMPD|nr:unnamed protein product [Timema podura]